MVFGRMFEAFGGGPKKEEPKMRDLNAEVQDLFVQTGKARQEHLNRELEDMRATVKAEDAASKESISAPRSLNEEVQDLFVQTGKARQEHLNRELEDMRAAAKASAANPEPVRMAQPERFVETVEIPESVEDEFRTANTNASKENSA